MTPRSEALAFRIWAYCEPRGWDVTIKDIAEALEKNRLVVGQVVKAKNWTERLRVQPKPPRNVCSDHTVPLDFLGREQGYFKRQLSDLANYS